MPTALQQIENIRAGRCDAVLASLYGPGERTLSPQRQRYITLLEDFQRHYGAEAVRAEVSLYSIPGRVEICGNHTDHNGGLVVAAAVGADIIAAAAKSAHQTICVKSQGFDYEDVLTLTEFAPDEGEHGRSLAIVRGVAAGIAERGGRLGGLIVQTSSNVLKGSGLSSSAAFEICIGSILNETYNHGRFDPLTLALIGQAAENHFFGKPSGLMDQVACAFGGVVAIDFKRPLAPEVEKIQFDPAKHGYRLVITDTKGSHTSLTPQYAAIRDEMESVARFFGEENLRAVGRGRFFGALGKVRAVTGDRAVLRAIHYFDENDRVAELKIAMRSGAFADFLRLIDASGRSSFEFNQNAYCPEDPAHQGIPLALALSREVLGKRGAWRLQGGGFAGTIIAFVEKEAEARYCAAMSDLFGADACHVLSFREKGPVLF